MEHILGSALRINAPFKNYTSRHHPKQFKCLHAQQFPLPGNSCKPLHVGFLFNNHRRIDKTLVLCTAPSQDAVSDLIPITTATTTDDTSPINKPPPPSSPLHQLKFDAMHEELALWRSKYRTTIVPRNAHDAGLLGDWVAAIRRLHRRGTLPTWALEKLNELDMDWKVDVLTAKWHANFHSTREFKEAHGGDACDLDEALPPDWGKIKTEGDGEKESEGSEESVRADWVEAARWLERQRELFVTEKLTDYRVWVLKRLLGIRLRRPYAPRRKNMHPALLKQNAAFKKLVAKDEAKAKAAGVGAGVEVAQGESDDEGI